jgi:TRAP-type C4-dicarboxylate transport system permease large subunit
VLSTLPILVLLVAVLAQWTASSLQSRVIALGESMWPGYGAELRRAPEAPVAPEPPAEEADDGVDQGLLNDLLGGSADAEEPSDDGVDQDLLGALLADDPEPTPVPEGQVDEDLLGALLADEPEAAPSEVPEGQVDEDLLGSLLEGEDVAADAPAEGEVDNDLLGALLGDDAPDPKSKAQERYERDLERFNEAQVRYDDAVVRRTQPLKRFAALDLGLEKFVTWMNGHNRHLFVVLLGLAGITATWTRHHIALRNVQGPVGDRLSAGLQFVGNGMMAASMVAQARSWAASGVEQEHTELVWMWVVAFGLMMAGNVWHMARPMKGPKVSFAAATLTVPLYTGMALLAGVWFFVIEGYSEGPAVYLDKLTEHSDLYLQVGLYVWAGMLLKRTLVAERSFDVLRPWKLPPELLAVVVVVISAVPTAYSGASGIFVIAAGAMLYRELRAAGARKSLALASAAMSGSLGVVLRPCLLVVIVAYLNPVSSDELFGLGKWVFVLTAVLFAAATLLSKQGKWSFNPAEGASKLSAKALGPLGAYLLVFALMMGVFRGVLDVGLDQLTAPMILPMVLVVMLLVDKGLARSQAKKPDAPPAPPLAPVGQRIEAATSEASVHIGALLMLMGMSVCLGGLVERGELMSVVPETFGSIWIAMAVLVAILVVVGMTMDPYGAVILVSATLAGVAEKNGISPVHFWMVVLVAFELGYLTPPVALNHLLVRQVVADLDDDPGPEDPIPTTFWRKHERILLPVTVMGIALVLVAFVPLALGWDL